MKQANDTPEWVARLVKNHPDVEVGEMVKWEDQCVGYRIRRAGKRMFLVYAGYLFSQSRIAVAGVIIDAAMKEGLNIVVCLDKRFYVFKILDIYQARPKADVVGGMPVILIPTHLGVNVDRVVKSAKQPELF